MQGTEWDRCGDNIAYAKTFAEEFVDIAEMEARQESERCLRAVNENDPKADDYCHFFKKRGQINKEKIHYRIAKLKMNLHNSDAGRNTVERTKKVRYSSLISNLTLFIGDLQMPRYVRKLQSKNLLA